MDKITIIEQPQIDGSIVEIVEIDRGNGEFTSMPKSLYDAMQAEQSTPSLTDETSTK
jgi:hypothetical protein